MFIDLPTAVWAAIVTAIGAVGVAALNRWRSRRQQSNDAVPGLVALNTALSNELAAAKEDAKTAEDREDRMRAERDAALAGKALAETTATLALAHMHVLETHINQGNPPPPPPRPEGLIINAR